MYLFISCFGQGQVQKFVLDIYTGAVNVLGMKRRHIV